MSFRFHILGIPHTATNREWLCCAYTQKVRRLCSMLRGRGHHVIHYGNAASEVDCDEHVTVTERADIGPPQGYLSFDVSGKVYRLFAGNAVCEIGKRKEPRDFLLCSFGHGHKDVALAHPDMIVVEPGIGYAGGFFARWRVFESYAILHAYYGLNAVGTAGHCDFYDAVIPNYFDPGDFEFSDRKDDYLLFLGRVYEGKGIHIATELAGRLNMRLVIAGPGERPKANGKTEFVGMVGEARRRTLLAHARALVAPSMFVEPFCGTVTEAHFSGTPTITPDWGAFAENNLHGLTGYRCRTMEQFEWAAMNIGRIRPADCRQWAQANFTVERVGAMYEEYFGAVAAVYGGKGWYEANPARRDLDWLTRRYPGLQGASK